MDCLDDVDHSCDEVDVRNHNGCCQGGMVEPWTVRVQTGHGRVVERLEGPSVADIGKWVEEETSVFVAGWLLLGEIDEMEVSMIQGISENLF